jgi:DNA-binding transcriptional MerR regulator
MTSDELTISEVAGRTGLTRHTLRYYERDGLMLGVGRAGSGHRRYSERDLGWIELITKLRATGMPIREVRRYAELVRAGDGNEDERLALLRAHRARVLAELDTMAAHLDAIDMKISYYASAIGARERPDSYLSSPRQAAASVPR